MFSVSNLSKSYRQQNILTNISLKVSKGEIVSIVGGNGCGKSTFLNILNGFVTCEQGEFIYENIPYSEDVGPLIRAQNGISTVFQEISVFEGLTVLENVLVGFKADFSESVWHTFFNWTKVLSFEAGKTEEAKKLLELVGLENKSGFLPSTLSFGQKKRLMFASALASNPSLLLLDEVFAGLDPDSSQQLIKVILQLAAGGCTVLFIEHNWQIISELATKVLIFDEATIKFEGSPIKFLNSDKFMELYVK